MASEQPKTLLPHSGNDDEDSGASQHSRDEHESNSQSDSSKTQSTGFKAPQKTAEERARDVQKRKEARRVNLARVICLVVFLSSAVSVSVAMYKFTRGNEQDIFYLEYAQNVKNIQALVTWEVKNNFAIMAQLSASVTSSAHLSNSRFPYLTNPDFEVSGGYADGLTGIGSVAFAPLVQGENQTHWEEYSVANQGWIAEGVRLRLTHPDHKDPVHGSFQDHEDRRNLQSVEETEIDRISDRVYTVVGKDKIMVPYQGMVGEVLAPVWQIAPTPGEDPKMVNFNLLADVAVKNLYEIMKKTNHTILSRSGKVDYLFDHFFDMSEKGQKELPHSYIAEPVYEGFYPGSKMVGFLIGITSWENLLSNILPADVHGITVVVKSAACGDVFTFELRGPKPVFQGYADHHDSHFDEHMRSFEVEAYPNDIVNGTCLHEMFVYPTQELRVSYESSKPIVFTCTVVTAFLGTAILFYFYDRRVSTQQKKASADAERTNAIVSSLFPANVRDRLYEDTNQGDNNQKMNNSDAFVNDGNKSFDDGESQAFKTRPIADLFPDVTVMFADIAGFTAWSSAREPAQVFLLLETLYSAFDAIAKRRRVFKVETVGDCYVAACGLPDPRKDHAIAMARFARDCIVKSNELTRALECTMGPDTADLAVRIGLHSGPVTAGVLRGDNARFQLFGDTMNTAARIESSGMPNRIHVSQEYADLLIAANKTRWLSKREDSIVAKGKGELQTYWLHLGGGPGSTRSSSDGGAVSVSAGSDDMEEINEKGGMDYLDKISMLQKSIKVAELNVKTQRLVDWNSSVLLDKLKEVVALRNAGLPDQKPTNITPEVTEQLIHYVSEVARRYHDNPFHNYEHASHVTMSVVKLLSRVVAYEEDCALKNYTRGISSNALTQFAVIFSALIHDVDHLGVPNARLILEMPEFAAKYENKSIAENNSIDIAWTLFLDPAFTAFRTCLVPSPTDLECFRQTVVHATLATDIVDPELKADRNARWENAFRRVVGNEDGVQAANERKVRIVLEHLIQASDVCHTMQHWHIYRKWNERLFEEMYLAYRRGRAGADPSEFWYQGEIGFFDFYIIPLAKKLADCGVFGVSSDEYLNYAEKNRKEWELKGQDIVDQMVAKFKAKYDTAEGEEGVEIQS